MLEVGVKVTLARDATMVAGGRNAMDTAQSVINADGQTLSCKG
jgi:hypothetical protein